MILAEKLIRKQGFDHYLFSFGFPPKPALSTISPTSKLYVITRCLTVWAGIYLANISNCRFHIYEPPHYYGSVIKSV